MAIASVAGAAQYGGGGGGIGHVNAPNRNGSGGSGSVRLRYAGGQVLSGGNSIYGSGGFTYHVFTAGGTLNT
jgi:hypothetical protein